MRTPDPLELKNIDPEDIFDMLVKVEKSFGFKFRKEEFTIETTFGGLCNIVTSKLSQTQVVDCTSQQAFYKLRDCICGLQSLPRHAIAPDTYIDEILLHKRASTIILQLEKEVGCKLNLLKAKTWISNLIGFVLIVSVAYLFINWIYGFSGILFTISCRLIAGRFGKEMKHITFGELALQITRGNYVNSRRDNRTINRTEITKVLKDLFSNELGLDPSVLSHDALLFY